MIAFAFRFLPFATHNTFKFASSFHFPLSQYKPSFFFCDSRKHDKSESHHTSPKTEGGDSKQQPNNHVESQLGKREGRHKHGPGCKHDHGHHHEKHHSFNPSHHHKHATNVSPPNVKLSKLSFEQLIEINSEDALKYAQMIYEQEEASLRELLEAKEESLRFIEFFKKTDHEIKEKERRLVENIDDYEQEMGQSERRAYKQLQESRLSAVSQLAKEFVQVADCVARCRKMAELISPVDPYIEKIVQAEQLIRGIMERHGIEEFDPTDQPFDPNYQESLTQRPTPHGGRTGYVAKTHQTGYKMRGRLLRSARVEVFI